MKKIIALVTFLLAFTINASAQEKKLNSFQAADKDMKALTSKVSIPETLQKDLLTLMRMKHQTLLDDSLSKEQKQEALKGYERKLMSGLSPDQRKELAKYPDVMNQLTH